MALQFIDGCQHYATADLLKKWGGSATGNSIDNTGNGPDGATQAIKGTAAGSLWLNKTISGSPTTVVAGFWIKPGQLGNSGVNPPWRFKEGATVHVSVACDSSGFINVWRGNQVALLGTAVTGAMSTSVGYYVQIKVKVDATVGTVEVKICQAGTLPATVLSLTGQNTKNGGAGIIDSFDILPATYTGVGAGSNFISHVFIADTTGSAPTNDFLDTPWGIETLTPSADGTYSQLTPSTGTNHSALVDEIPPNTTDYNSSNTAPNKDTYQMTNMASLKLIYAIQVLDYVALDVAGTANAATTIRSASTDSDGTSTVVNSTTYTYLRDIWTNDPATGVAWTYAGVNAMEAGMKVTVSGQNVRNSQTIVEVFRSYITGTLPAIGIQRGGFAGAHTGNYGIKTQHLLSQPVYGVQHGGPGLGSNTSRAYRPFGFPI